MLGSCDRAVLEPRTKHTVAKAAVFTSGPGGKAELRLPGEPRPTPRRSELQTSVSCSGSVTAGAAEDAEQGEHWSGEQIGRASCRERV